MIFIILSNELLLSILKLPALSFVSSFNSLALFKNSVLLSIKPFFNNISAIVGPKEPLGMSITTILIFSVLFVFVSLSDSLESILLFWLSFWVELFISVSSIGFSDIFFSDISIEVFSLIDVILLFVSSELIIGVLTTLSANRISNLQPIIPITIIITANRIKSL